MLTRFIFILLSLFSAQFVFADRCTLTVVAESGLNLRKSPNLESDILKLVKFGETVLADGICDFNHPRFTDEIVSKEGIKGFWMEVSYNRTNGYMFSGFLVIGDIFPYSRNDSIDNVIIDEIYSYEDYGTHKVDSFNYQYYSSHLNWYGVNMNSATVCQTKLSLKYNNNRWDKDRFNETQVYLQVENEELYDFLLGTRIKLNTGEFDSQLHLNCDQTIGIFLYPEQEYSINYNSKKYKFKAIEELSLSANQQESNRIKRNYTINLYIWNDLVKIQDKKNILNLYADARINSAYENPKLFWSGDLNRDGYLDFIFEVSPMADKCGAFPYLRFIYSNITKDNEVDYRANRDILNLDNFVEN